MIKVIDVESKPITPNGAGRVRNILGAGDGGTRVQAAIAEVDPGKTYRLAASDRTQVVYILEGKDAKVTYATGDQKSERTAQRRTGVYLEPGEEATVTATASPLKLLLVTVPKHTGKPGASDRPSGYFFEEAQLRSLIDAKSIRERTFWVNKETGLSGSWDLQLGRMLYAPHGYSPRHVHHPSKTTFDFTGTFLPD